MVWTLEVSDQAPKQLRKIDIRQAEADRITRAMTDVAQLDIPASAATLSSATTQGTGAIASATIA